MVEKLTDKKRDDKKESGIKSVNLMFWYPL